MNEQEREDFTEQLRAIEAAAEKVEELARPYDDLRREMFALRGALLERYNTDVRGECETCERVLLEGDKGHVCEDDPMFCEECAPTLQNCLDQWRERLAAGDLDRDQITEANEAIENLTARIAAEGADTKAVWEL